jgi:hypothetical protein
MTCKLSMAMLWCTSSVILFLVCFIHGISAAIYGVSAGFQQSTYTKAIFTDLTASKLGVGCHSGTCPRLEDCYSALRFIDDHLEEQRWELVRNARNRELGNPSTRDRKLSQSRFRLPAAISHGSCLIIINIYFASFHDYYHCGDPERSPLQLSTEQYFHIWEESVQFATTKILEGCVSIGSWGSAFAKVDIDDMCDLDFLFKVTSTSM